MNQIAQQAEIVVIDEAHHFRNRASSRYRKLFDMMAEGPQKQMFMLTATPINNSFLDLQHLIGCLHIVKMITLLQHHWVYIACQATLRGWRLD